MKNKGKVNYIIDGAMFLLMMALAGIGLLMKYVLLTGRDATLKYGTPVDLLFMGADRHDWGKIHFIVSLVLVGLLALHIYLHWKSIVALFRKLIRPGRARLVTATAFLGVSVVLVAFPIAVRPQLVDREPLRRMARESSVESSETRRARTDLPTPEPRNRPASQEGSAEVSTAQTVIDTVLSPNVEEGEHERTLLIQGYMTVREVAQRYDVPESYILDKLGITDAGAAAQRLGTLRRTHDFRMSAIEDYINEYRKENPPS